MFLKSNLIEVNANGFWDNEEPSPNLDFLRLNNRAMNPDNSMFLMDGSNYPEQLEKAKEFGCTEAFTSAYAHAINVLNAELVLFNHDV